jgi:hypothetical protein
MSPADYERLLLPSDVYSSSHTLPTSSSSSSIPSSSLSSSSSTSSSSSMSSLFPCCVYHSASHPSPTLHHHVGSATVVM